MATRKKTSNVADILDAVLTYDSEFEGLSDEEDGDGWPSDDENDDKDSGDESWSSSDDEPLASLSEGTKRKKPKKKQCEIYNFEERRQFVPPQNTDFRPVDIQPPPDAEQTPYQFFKQFVTHEMLQNIVTETNKYSVEKDGQSIQLTVGELEKYIGIYFLMGLVKMPTVSSYWEEGTNYKPISDHMVRNRFQKIASRLHFTDNNTVTDEQKEDRVWKLRPWIHALRTNFQAVSSTEHQSIDEIMVAFKGHNLLKQYMSKKPKKWGFKLWGRCAASGFCQDFEIYQGKGTGMNEALAPNCGLGGSVVLQLCDRLPRGHQFKIFADNFFTSFALATEIRDRDIGQFLGTIQSNRCHKAPLKTEKELARDGRGAVSTVYDKDRQLVLVRWYDNKAVTLLSTSTAVEPCDTVKRYDKKTKTHIYVKRPAVIEEYNTNMGGVDLLDMMCTLYKRLMKSKRWYLYIWYHTLTMSMVNAWFIYRRDCKIEKVKKVMPLRHFLSQVAEALTKKGKPTCVGRPSLAMLLSPPVKRKRVLPSPVNDVRYDRVDHWPIYKENRSRCRHCSRYTNIACTKCSMFLCMVSARNCFTAFHVKK